MQNSEMLTQFQVVKLQTYYLIHSEMSPETKAVYQWLVICILGYPIKEMLHNNGIK